MKTQSKIVILLFIVFITYTLIFSWFIYFSISQYSFTDFYKRLEIKAAITAKTELDLHQDNAAIKELKNEYLEKLENEEDFIFEITSAISVAAEAKKVGVPVTFINELINTGNATYNKNNTFFAGIKYTAGGHSYGVVVSAENYYNTHHRIYLRNLLGISIVIALIFIYLISISVTRRIIRPIKNIINEVKEISTENLNQRLAVPEEKDEFAELAATFNDMLNRLQTSFETQNNFVSNASHEFNTPLTAIIGEADVALAKPRSQTEYVEALNVILHEAEKLDKKTRALLFLAQSGFNGKKQKFESLRVDQLILDVKETALKIYPGSKISIDFSLLPENHEKLVVNGNEQLLHLAFSNILANACKYSNNRAVNISLGASAKRVVIVIKDTGIGIPEGEMKYIYDPFYRASNTGSVGGYGIGLPLTRSIIRMHNGDMEVTSVLNVGTTVQLALPLTEAGW